MDHPFAHNHTIPVGVHGCKDSNRIFAVVVQHGSPTCANRDVRWFDSTIRREFPTEVPSVYIRSVDCPTALNVTKTFGALASPRAWSRERDRSSTMPNMIQWKSTLLDMCPVPFGHSLFTGGLPLGLSEFSQLAGSAPCSARPICAKRCRHHGRSGSRSSG